MAASRVTTKDSDAVAESVSIWFRLLSCHAMMLAELRRELEAVGPRSRRSRPELASQLASQRAGRVGRGERSSPTPTITLPRFDLLANLHREDGQSLAALSRALLVTAGNVTGLVDRAERDGVVERRPDPHDGRLARVWLTKRGRALVDELLPIHASQIHALLAGLPAQDRKVLRRTLGALRDHLPNTTSTSPKASPSSRASRGERVSTRTRA